LVNESLLGCVFGPGNEIPVNEIGVGDASLLNSSVSLVDTILLKLLEVPAIVEQLGNSFEEQRIEITSSLSVTLREMRVNRLDELEVIHRGQLQSKHLEPWSGHGIVARHNLVHTLLKRGRVEKAKEINDELLEFW
jgi:hypothetical protein